MAVWPPDDVLDRVAALARPPVDGLRWTPREQWHVTLRFLGPVADVDGVLAALAGVDAAPATARLGPALDRFGQRILHVPVSGLAGLATLVVGATAELGRRPDDRPFAGHVTLARAAKTGRVDLRRLAGVPLEASWEVASFCLVESRPSSAGARYDVLERFRL